MIEEKQTRFEGVMIDLGGTLAYIDETGNRKYLKALLSIAREFSYQEDLKELTKVLDEIIRNSMKGEFKDMKQFWKQFLKKLGISPTPAIVNSFEMARSRHSSTVYQLYNGSLSVLTNLRSRYELALVSNCAIGTSDVIRKLRLANFFKCVILSYQVGVRKPHRQMYLEALNCLELKPDKCVFVADEISDLEGAKEIGIGTILIRQGQSTFLDAKNPNFQPDFECDTIAEVEKFI